VVKLAENTSTTGLFGELFDALDKHKCHYNIRTISNQEYNALESKEEADCFVLTLMASSLKTEAVDAVIRMAVQFGLSVTHISRLSLPVDRSGTLNNSDNECYEILFKGCLLDEDVLRSSYRSVSSRLGVEIILQKESVYRCQRRLVVFDMDSTLINAEVIDLLAEAAGQGEQVARITARAMRGELDFKESYEMRLKMLRGLNESVIDTIKRQLPITEGAETLFGTLKALGYKTAIISGGFSCFAGFLQDLFGIDYVFGNELDVAGGEITGDVCGEIIDGQKKAYLLQQLAEAEGIAIEQVVAVGDGANDIPMLNLAGLGVAFHAKPFVRQSTSHSITHLGIDNLLFLLGHGEPVLSAVE
jgi:phosphoserine phosphatase